MRPLIVFDLDGTLVDSARDLAESANEMLATYGAASLAEDEIAGMVGDGARQLVTRALERAAVRADVTEALDRFISVYSGRLLRHTRLYPGVTEAVRLASSRASLAVLTNKPTELSHQIVEAFELSPYFTWVVGGDWPFARKPDPAGLLHVMAEAGAPPGATLMVGDSMIDVETARRAGTVACVAGYGFGHLRRPITREADDLLVTEPGDLAAAIEQFLARVS
jgi:phosphoglycolate phosphatase